MPPPLTRRAVLRIPALLPLVRPLHAQPPAGSRATVSLVRGENRRRNISQALVEIDQQIQPLLKTKKYVVIKVNTVSTGNPLACTHRDAIHGILDYLEPRYKGPIRIVEGSAGDSMEAFEMLDYARVAAERKGQRVELIDLHRERQFRIVQLLDYDLRPVAARLAARLFDPDAYIFSSAVLKTHNVVVGTYSVKNIAMGAPLHSPPGESPSWNDKRKAHNGIRQTNYNIFLMAQALKPFWGAAVIDGYEGMEGNGPAGGTPAPSRIAIASTDFVAADRIGVEAMGINAAWLGYLRYCADFGVGQYDLDKIDIRGEKIDTVRRKYQLHRDIERQLEWMSPLREIPSRLG